MSTSLKNSTHSILSGIQINIQYTSIRLSDKTDASIIDLNYFILIKKRNIFKFNCELQIHS